MEPGLEITATFPSRHLHIGSKFKLKFYLKCLRLWAEQKKRDTAKDHCIQQWEECIIVIASSFRVRILLSELSLRMCLLVPWLAAVHRLFMFSLTVQNIWPVWSRWKLCNQWISWSPHKALVSRIIPLGCLLPWPVWIPLWVIGPCLCGGRDYRIGSNFGKFYLIRTSFTLGDPVSLVKVFRLFRLERIFFGVQLRVWTQ
jgi:hypothetical protein